MWRCVRRTGLLALLAVLGCDDPTSAEQRADAGCVGAGCEAPAVPDAAPPGPDARPDGAPPVPDAAAADVLPPRDASPPDSSPPDEGPPDEGPPDARPPDAGDASPVGDAAIAADAGPDPDPDAAPDLGVPPIDAAPDAALDDACPAEACNGLDDDCDGRVDEDFALAERCEGPGRCGVGFVECGDDGEARCSTEPGGSTDQSGPERCNGLDDDCDGEIDEHPEALARACYTGPEGTEGVGACRGGLRACVDGRLDLCAGDRTPRAEICNGEDDDCDGLVDEGLVYEQACGRGVCRAGSTPGGCVEGVERLCAPGPTTGDDSDCDGVDDDCDGRADEAYLPVADCGAGRCGAAATPSRCEGGVEIPCQPGAAAPADATCDGLDDDCDGEIDEDYVPVEGCGVGACRAGAVPSACVDGREIRCQPGAPAADDATCDDVDDDCDGRADEDYLPVVGCGVGLCAVGAEPSRCISGFELPCRPREPMPDDQCNGQDDDCDGHVDEGYRVDAACGLGVCRAGNTPSACEAGVETPCVPGPPLAPDDGDCDHLDGDCDGRVDEDRPRLLGEIRVTNEAAPSLRPRMVLDTAGQGYAIVWADGRLGDARVFFQRVGAGGALVGQPRQVSFLGGNHYLPSITRTPGGYGVTWENTRGAALQVYFARTDADGVVVQNDTQLVETGRNATQSRVLFDGQAFGVVWVDFRDGPPEVWFQRLDADGVPQGGNVRVTDVAGAVSQPSLVSRGPDDGWAVAYAESVDGDVDVWVQLLDPRGNPVGPRQRITDGGGNSNDPSLVRAGNGYGVAWFDTRDDNAEIYFARLDAQGARQGPEVRVTNQLNASTQPSLEWNGGSFAVAWIDQRGAALNAWFQHLTAAGAPFGEPIQLSDSRENSLSPTLVYSGAGYGVSYYDLRHGEGEIYFAHGPMGCNAPAE